MFRMSRSLSVVLLVAFVMCCTLSGCHCKKGPKVEPPVTNAKEKPAAPAQKPAETPVPGRVQDGQELSDPNLVTVYFDFDKYDVRKDAAEVLKTDAAWIKANLNKEFAQIKIEGHCDQRGTDKYNMVLGEKRANAVRDFLVSEGVPADILVSVSYGKAKIAAEGETEEAYAKNRRGEFKKIIGAAK